MIVFFTAGGVGGRGRRAGDGASTDWKVRYKQTLRGIDVFAYARRRQVRRELGAVIKSLQEEYDEAIRSIPEESPAEIRGVMKGIVKGGIKKECKREMKGNREEYASKGMPEEEYEGTLQMLEAAVEDMCKEYKVEEKVGHFIFSSVMLVRGWRRKLQAPPNEAPCSN